MHICIWLQLNHFITSFHGFARSRISKSQCIYKIIIIPIYGYRYEIAAPTLLASDCSMYADILHVYTCTPTQVSQPTTYNITWETIKGHNYNFMVCKVIARQQTRLLQ